jgi:hypothetical protein
MAKEQVMEKTAAAARDALDHARVVAQELHRTISDTVAKRATAKKAEVESAIQKAKEAAEATRSAMRTQHGAAQETIKQRLTEAVGKLEASEKHATESLKSSGEAFHTALSKALADARASVQHLSGAVAVRRSEHAAKHAPVKRAS